MKQLKSTFSKILISALIFSVNPLYPHEQSLTNVEEASLGKTDFPISCSKEVQPQFNKGLALLHNMMYLQSEKEFTAVAKHEPDCAMAYWGIAMTLFHPLWAPPSSDELKRGWEAIQKAAALNPPTKREMGYIGAVTAFYKDWESIDHPTRISTWEKHQEKIFSEYPEDIDAGAFYALAHLATASKGDKTFTHQKKAGEIIENLRAKAPLHPGMFHYTIHAYDNPLLASRALEVAKEYDKIAPDAPHAQHMPSHIFVRMGLWELSAQWNIRSAEAAKKQSKPGELSLHYIHAMDYLIYAYLQKAEDNKAQDILATVNKVERYQDSFVSAYGIAAVQARYFLELREWEKAAKLKLRTHSTFPWNKYPWYEAITYFARGLGAARSNDIGKAQDSIRTLDTFYKHTKKAEQDYWAVLVDSQRKSVAAWTAYSEGKTDKALHLMKKAAEIEDSVDKHPVTPGAVLPARELLGDMLVLLGKYNEAIDAYEATLLISPNRFNSLYGAGYAAQNAGDFTKAKFYYEKLVALTSGVESDRPSIKNAKAFLGFLTLGLVAKKGDRNTANVVSLNPEDANSYRSFAPELEKTIARMPQLDPETQLYVEEVKPNLFYVTEGIYQSAFLNTGAGVIVFDAPPSFAHKLPKVIKHYSPNEPIKYLIYSHGHSDHVGGASAFSKIQDLQVVAPLKVAQSIKLRGNPYILSPTITFTDQYHFSLGDENVELKSASFHSEDEDVLIYVPKQKFIMAVDTITPGEAPFMDFGVTADIGEYLKSFDKILAYDFDIILSGHVSILGNRADVIEAKEYAFDVRDSVLKGIQTLPEQFTKTFTAFEYKNANLAYRSAIEQLRGKCSAEIIEKWKDRLSVVDVWADSHCEKMILYYIMH